MASSTARSPRHAQRLVTGEGEHACLVDRQHRAFDLVRQSAEITEPFGDVAQLRRHLGDQLAIVARLDRRQASGVLRDQVGETDRQLSACACRQPGPFRRPEGSGLRGRYRCIDLSLAVERNRGPRLPYRDRKTRRTRKRAGAVRRSCSGSRHASCRATGRIAEIGAEAVLDEYGVARRQERGRFSALILRTNSRGPGAGWRSRSHSASTSSSVRSSAVSAKPVACATRSKAMPLPVWLDCMPVSPKCWLSSTMTSRFFGRAASSPVLRTPSAARRRR